MKSFRSFSEARALVSDEDTERWKRMRRAYVTASDVAPILGRSRWATREDVLYRKRNAVEIPVTNHMLEGQRFEPFVLSDVGAEPLGGVLYGSTRHPWLACTPDGYRDDHLVEVKCPMKSRGLTEEYYWQAMTQMVVCGERRCVVVVFERSTGRVKEYPLTLNDLDTSILLYETLAFFVELHIQ